jgi:hypothetical protein
MAQFTALLLSEQADRLSCALGTAAVVANFFSLWLTFFCGGLFYRATLRQNFRKVLI